jgi:hypothetical protein
MLRSETRTRGQSSDFGIVNIKRLAFAMPRTPNPPKNKQRVRNVQTGISLSPIFIIGQLVPQKIERKITKTSPMPSRNQRIPPFNIARAASIQLGNSIAIRIGIIIRTNPRIISTNLFHCFIIPLSFINISVIESIFGSNRIEVFNLFI